jgi:hypothetical protein
MKLEENVNVADHRFHGGIEKTKAHKMDGKRTTCQAVIHVVEEPHQTMKSFVIGVT